MPLEIPQVYKYHAFCCWRPGTSARQLLGPAPSVWTGCSPAGIEGLMADVGDPALSRLCNAGR
jgi:hypothetical protein